MQNTNTNLETAQTLHLGGWPRYVLLPSDMPGALLSLQNALQFKSPCLGWRLQSAS
jgi:hypothetical protein